MKSRTAKIVLVLTVAIVLFGSILIINTIRFRSKQVHVEPIQTATVDDTTVASRLAQALRFQTVSHQEVTQTKGEEFLAFHRYLEQTFPKVHSVLTKETVGDYSLLY